MPPTRNRLRHEHAASALLVVSNVPRPRRRLSARRRRRRRRRPCRPCVRRPRAMPSCDARCVRSPANASRRCQWRWVAQRVPRWHANCLCAKSCDVGNVHAPVHRWRPTKAVDRGPKVGRVRVRPCRADAKPRQSFYGTMLILRRICAQKLRHTGWNGLRRRQPRRKWTWQS